MTPRQPNGTCAVCARHSCEGECCRPPAPNPYHKLHDILSDMIEGGRLTEADIPDDYQALVEALVNCLTP